MELKKWQNAGVSISKSAIGAIPYVGTLLNEAFFEYHGRVKQQRINGFIEELRDYMNLNVSEQDIDFKYVKSEYFSDFFESIVDRIQVNNQADKIKRFKLILINQMKTPYESDHTETFLDIVSKINEKQIEILNVFRRVHNGNIPNEDNLQDREFLDTNHERKTSDFRSPDYFNIKKEVYMFYVQDLVSKSLLLDDSVNRIGTRPYEILEITHFGIEFLRFVEGNEYEA